LAESKSINDEEEGAAQDAREKAAEVVKQLVEIGELITDGAIQFLIAEYTYLGIFCLVFAVIIGFTVDLHEMQAAVPSNFPYTATAFLVGAGTSIVAGYIGMRIAVYTNNRTTYNCCKGELVSADVPDMSLDSTYLEQLVKFYNIKSKEAATAEQAGASGETRKGQTKDLKEGFMTAFQGGQVLGFTLVGLALLILEVLLLTFKATWFDKVAEGVLADATIVDQD